MAGESPVEYVNDSQKKFAPEFSDFISDVARKLVAVVVSVQATSHGLYNCTHRSLGTRVLLWSVPSSSLMNKASTFFVFAKVSAEDVGSLVRPEYFYWPSGLGFHHFCEFHEMRASFIFRLHEFGYCITAVVVFEDDEESMAFRSWHV